MLQIKSCDNHTDLFTKLLPLAIFNKCVKDIDMRRLKDLHVLGGEPIPIFLIKCITLYFFLYEFYKNFSLKDF
jgi:hypothetical protein